MELASEFSKCDSELVRSCDSVTTISRLHDCTIALFLPLRLLARLLDKNQSVLGTGHRAFDRYQITLRVHLNHFQIRHSDAFRAHVSCAACAFQYATGRGRRRRRTGAAQTVGLTVRFGSATKMMTFHYAGGAFAFADAGHIDAFADLKQGSIQFLTNLVFVQLAGSHLAQVFEQR